MTIEKQEEQVEHCDFSDFNPWDTDFDASHIWFLSNRFGRKEWKRHSITKSQKLILKILSLVLLTKSRGWQKSLVQNLLKVKIRPSQLRATGNTVAGACSSSLISYSISLLQDNCLSNTQVRRTNGQGASNPGAPCSPFSPLGPFLPFFPFSPCGYNGLDKTSFILLGKKNNN